MSHCSLDVASAIASINLRRIWDEDVKEFVDAYTFHARCLFARWSRVDVGLRRRFCWCVARAIVPGSRANKCTWSGHTNKRKRQSLFAANVACEESCDTWAGQMDLVHFAHVRFRDFAYDRIVYCCCCCCFLSLLLLLFLLLKLLLVPLMHLSPISHRFRVLIRRICPLLIRTRAKMICAAIRAAYTPQTCNPHGINVLNRRTLSACHIRVLHPPFFGGSAQINWRNIVALHQRCALNMKGNTSNNRSRPR